MPQPREKGFASPLAITALPGCQSRLEPPLVGREWVTPGFPAQSSSQPRGSSCTPSPQDRPGLGGFGPVRSSSHRTRLVPGSPEPAQPCCLQSRLNPPCLLQNLPCPLRWISPSPRAPRQPLARAGGTTEPAPSPSSPPSAVPALGSIPKPLPHPGGISGIRNFSPRSETAPGAASAARAGRPRSAKGKSGHGTVTVTRDPRRHEPFVPPATGTKGAGRDSRSGMIPAGEFPVPRPRRARGSRSGTGGTPPGPRVPPPVPVRGSRPAPRAPAPPAPRGSSGNNDGKR